MNDWYYVRGILFHKTTDKMFFPSLTLLSLLFRDKRRALEIGCGNGEKSYWLSLMFDSYYAIDINANAIGYAKQNKPDIVPIEFVSTTIENVKEENFDAIILIYTFHLQNNYQTMFEELTKRLNSDGVILIIEPHTEPFGWMDDRLNKNSQEFDEKIWAYKLKQLYDTHEFLLSHGFNCIEQGTKFYYK